jgi:energy-coupling factor transporter ATP-binding protein EcfA2
VLDEPTTGMDETSTERVISEIKRVARQGATVVVATHDAELARCCDNCVHLERGSVVATARSPESNSARLR